jgi:hypothetical protein
MSRVPARTALSALLCLAAPAGAEPRHVHEGEWEITTQTVLTGLPFQPQPTTIRQCITGRDPVPKPNQQPGPCEISTVRARAERVSWQIKCTGAHPSEGSGEITYAGDSMEGQATLKITEPRSGRPIEAKQTFKGHRVGDCPAAKELAYPTGRPDSATK